MISTLDKKIRLTSERNDGNSTRQVDFTIQKLFQGEEVHLLGHFAKGENVSENINLVCKVTNRLASEHSSIDYIIKPYNKISNSIKLI